MWNPKALFLRHAREIQRFLRGCGHGKDEAADLTQDVFVRLLGSSSTATGDHSRAYLYTVARNLSTDAYRRQQVAPLVNVADEDLCNVPDPTPSPERIAASRQKLRAMRQALDELPEPARRAFELYRFGDLTLEEVADQLNLSVSRTWALVRQAYQHLRVRLHEDTA